MSDSEHGRAVAPISDAERLARAVLLFHDGQPWNNEKQELWIVLTGQRTATTRVLCDLARQIRSTEEGTKRNVR